MIKNAILILGMHRSGTSSLTRVMSLLGAGLPKTLLGQNEGNQRGHWESEAIIAAHDDMLAGLGSHWTDFRSLALPTRKATRARFIGEAEDLIAAEYQGAETIVIKEPRICRFADSYIEALSHVAKNIHVIIPSRNPLEVAASLEKRDDISETQALFLWLSHMIGAEQGSRGQSRSFVDYADYLDAPVAQTARLVDTMPFSLPYDIDAMQSQIKRYVEPGLKRQSARDEDVAQHGLARGWVDSVYRALHMLAGDPQDAVAMKAIDRVANAFYPAAETLWTLCQDQAQREKAHAQTLADQGAALSALADDHAKAWQSRADEHAKAWHASDLETKAEIAALKARYESAAEAANTVLAARDAQITQNQADLTRAQTEQSELSHALEQSAQRESALNDGILALNRDIAALVETREALTRENAALRAQLEDAQTAVRTLQTERGFLQDEFDHLLEKAESDLAARENDVAASNHALWEAKQETAALRGSLDSVLSSTSWRMTKSLRAVINGLRGGPRALPQAEAPPRLEHKGSDED